MVDIDELISVISLPDLDGTVALETDECDLIIEALEFFREEHANK